MRLKVEDARFLLIAACITCAVCPTVLIVLADSPALDSTGTNGRRSVATIVPAAVSDLPQAQPALTTQPVAIAPPASPATQQSSDTPSVNPTRDAKPTLGREMSMAVQSAVAEKTFQTSVILGGAFAQYPYQDISPDGVLIGFRIGLGKFFDNDVLKFLQPIYRTPSGEVLGQGFGNGKSGLMELKAPPGFAVGAIAARGGGGLDAITVTFMPIVGDRLDPNAAGYVSSRIGGPGGSESRVGGDGTPIIGLCGRASEKGDYLGVGVVLLHRTSTAKQH